jgi:hypothetical protein
MGGERERERGKGREKFIRKVDGRRQEKREGERKGKIDQKGGWEEKGKEKVRKVKRKIYQKGEWDEKEK